MRRIASPVLVLALTLAVGAHPAAAAPQKFKNCTAVHKKYAGGIARPGAHQKPGQPKLKKRPYFNAALYKANSSLDRDKDGIACEVS